MTVQQFVGQVIFREFKSLTQSENEQILANLLQIKEQLESEELAILRENTYFFLSISEEIKESIDLYKNREEEDTNFRIELQETFTHEIPAESQQKHSLSFRVTKLPKDSREL